MFVVLIVYFCEEVFFLLTLQKFWHGGIIEVMKISVANWIIVGTFAASLILLMLVVISYEWSCASTSTKCRFPACLQRLTIYLSHFGWCKRKHINSLSFSNKNFFASIFLSFDNYFTFYIFIAKWLKTDKIEKKKSIWNKIENEKKKRNNRCNIR